MPDVVPVAEGAPLGGVKVLDFTLNLPGPYATFLLCSLGAEVVKVEPPKGDPARHMGELFALLNAGKKSVVLDLKDEASRPVVRRMVERSDVLVEGFRPGVMERLGCGWETARRWNPRLVYCSVSAYGQNGPKRDLPGHDLNLQALSGVCHLERDGRDVPRGSALPLADLSTSMVAVSAICAALVARGTHGQGRYLDVAMGDAVLSWATAWGEGVDLASQARKRVGRPALAALGGFLRRVDREKLYAMPQYGVYRCRDGAWLTLGIVDEAHFWKALCRALGLGPMAGLPMPVLTLVGPGLRRIIGLRLRTRSRQHWLEVLGRAGVPVSPVLSPIEAKADPQFRYRGLVCPSGRVRAPLPGAVALEGAAPALGEHNAEWLE